MFMVMCPLIGPLFIHRKIVYENKTILLHVVVSVSEINALKSVNH